MTEGNSNNSVRDRISMLVDAQEGGVRPNEVAQNNDTPKNRKNFLKVLIPVLAVAVVGVVVAIVFVLKPRESMDRQEIIDNLDNMSIEAVQQRNTRRVEALNDCRVVEEMYRDATLNYEEALKNFDKKMLSSDPVYNIYFAICYASFLYDNEGIESSIRIMEKVGKEIEMVNDDILIDYYVAMRSLYKYYGDEEKSQYYNGLVVELLIPSEEYEGNITIDPSIKEEVDE